MDAYAKQAVHAGLTGICFLDHLTLLSTISNQSMTIGEVGLYFQAVKRLKMAYQDCLDIKVGLEIDFEPEQVSLVEDIVGRFAFDLIGGSVHFIENRNIVSRRSNRTAVPLAPEYVWGHYITKLNKMLDSGWFDVVCHLDVPKKLAGVMPREFIPEIEEVLARIAAKGFSVEINTGGLDHPAGETYPSMDLLGRCHQLGIPFVLGSDAHQPEEVGRHFDHGVSMLRSVGVHELSTYTARNRESIPLSC